VNYRFEMIVVPGVIRNKRVWSFREVAGWGVLGGRVHGVLRPAGCRLRHFPFAKNPNTNAAWFSAVVTVCKEAVFHACRV